MEAGTEMELAVMLLGIVLASFNCQLDTVLNHLRRGPQLRTYLEQIDLWGYLQKTVFLIDIGRISQKGGGAGLYKKASQVAFK